MKFFESLDIRNLYLCNIFVTFTSTIRYNILSLLAMLDQQVDIKILITWHWMHVLQTWHNKLLNDNMPLSGHL